MDLASRHAPISYSDSLPQSPSNDLVRIFGPSFGSLNEEVTLVLKPCPPPEEEPVLFAGDKLLVQSKTIPPSDKIKSWPRSSDDWRQWIDRLSPKYRQLWETAGIATLIDMSRVSIKPSKNILAAALSLWSRKLNSFVFPFGLMSITLRDIVALTGLPVLGEEVPSLVDPKKPNKLPSFSSPKESTSYTAIISRKRPSSPPNDEEHILFLWVLICKYIFCPFGGYPTKEYVTLARAIAGGRQLALGTMFLGSVYHALARITDEAPFTKFNGSLWIVQLWLFSYFPELRALDFKLPAPSVSYGYGLMSCSCDWSINQVLSFFLEESSSRPPSLFYIYNDEDCGDIVPWWLKHSDQSGKTLSILRDNWIKLLTSRHLHVGASFSTHLELYFPAFWARQFGLVQAIPGSPTFINPHTGPRIAFSKHDALARAQNKEPPSFPLAGMYRSESAISEMFERWWRNTYNQIIPDSIPSPSTGNKSIYEIINDDAHYPLSQSSEKRKASAKVTCSRKRLKKSLKKKTIIELKEETISSMRRSSRVLARSHLNDSADELELNETENENMGLLLKAISRDENGGKDRLEHTDVSHTPPVQISSPQSNGFYVTLITEVSNPIADLDFSFIPGSAVASARSTPEQLISEAKATLRQILSFDIFSLSEAQKDDALSAISTLSSALTSSDAISSLDKLASFIDLIYSSFKEHDAVAMDLRSNMRGVLEKRERMMTLLDISKSRVEENEDLRASLEKNQERIKALEQQIANLKKEQEELIRRGKEIEVAHAEDSIEVESLGQYLKAHYPQLKTWTEKCAKVEEEREKCIKQWRELSGSFDFDAV